jgi:protein-tyrosine phosphatase
MTTDSESDRRVIHLDGGVNFRDIGGYPVADGRRIRWGAVFRSGTTHRLNAMDRGRLAQLDIRTVVDLRSNKERSDFPHGLADMPTVIYYARNHERVTGNLTRMLKQHDVDTARMRTAMIELYRELPYQFAEGYRKIFSVIGSGSLPLAFNCAAGKDRTGVVAALILMCLGVSWEDVVHDYLLSEQFVGDTLRIFGWSEAGEISGAYNPAVVSVLFGVSRSYIEAMHEAIISRSGSMENYFRSSLSMDDDLREAIRRRLLMEAREALHRQLQEPQLR